MGVCVCVVAVARGGMRVMPVSMIRRPLQKEKHLALVPKEPTKNHVAERVQHRVVEAARRPAGRLVRGSSRDLGRSGAGGGGGAGWAGPVEVDAAALFVGTRGIALPEDATTEGSASIGGKNSYPSSARRHKWHMLQNGSILFSNKWTVRRTTV